MSAINKKTRADSIRETLSKVVPSDTEQFPWQMPSGYKPIPVAFSLLRGRTNKIGVHTDAAAVAVWLAEAADKSVKTATTYRREAERLLLWASEIKGLALCQLESPHYLEFYEFLQAVPKDWIFKGKALRTSPKWRPFQCQPSATSIAQTIYTISNLLEYLTANGWLIANPMPRIKFSAQPQARKIVATIPQPIIDLLYDVTRVEPSAETSKETLMVLRDRWILSLMLGVGASISDMKMLTSSFKKTIKDGRIMWHWHAKDYDGKLVPIPVPPAIMGDLMALRTGMGFPPLPVDGDPVPLVPSFLHMGEDGNFRKVPLPLGRIAINDRLKNHIFATAIERGAAAGFNTKLLKKASASWLRNTAIARAARDSLELAQTMSRCKDFSSTARYLEANIN